MKKISSFFRIGLFVFFVLAFAAFFFYKKVFNQTKTTNYSAPEEITETASTKADSSRIGEKLGPSYDEVNRKKFYNIISKSFSLGFSSDPTSLSIIKDILPGKWRFDVHCILYIDDKFNFILADYEKYQEGVIVDLGIIVPIENGLVFEGVFEKTECRFVEYSFTKASENPNDTYYDFTISFDKDVFLSTKYASGIRAVIESDEN